MKCFIIMPISDDENYPAGHFGRVYEHIIKPACERAGFEPVRADDIMTTNYIALDVIKNILSCEMALCDLSSRNPNVLYELGIRQAFNLPVTLIKDVKTKRIFDIQGFRDIEYDESLRIDTVETTIDDLSITIKNTFENKQSEINSLISLLGIEPAKINERKKISADTELILNSLSIIEKRMNIIESKNISKVNDISSSLIDTLPFLTQNDVDNLKVGDKIFHTVRGTGEILTIAQTSSHKISLIKFANTQIKMMISANSKSFRKI